MNRSERSKITYTELFGEAPSAGNTDPELMTILQQFIFGEVFYVGNLDNKLRELITVVLLATLQTLPQLKGHTQAALRVGNTPSEIKEAVYQCAPFIGFPRTLNAVTVLNEVFQEQGIQLPLESMATISETERYTKGRAIQEPLYGHAIKERMSTLPEPMNDIVPQFVSEFGFGDFYTRNGLDVKTRELLILCGLVALGAEHQIKSHINGNLKAGNDKETITSAIIHTIPYVGLPYALNALAIIRDINE